jgi:hypothetical protein
MKFQTLSEFYHYYLGEHQNIMCRRLHFIGTSFVITILMFVLLTFKFSLLLLIPVMGYGFAWVGHFVFEKNKPATFKHPIYSLLSDFIMFKDILVGRLPAWN